ncbi:hypothetical protein J3458_001842 [Metarhizium acridum]|uniref:Glutathione S-transferase, putative n=1 Tax=Metarhizium acridum (strain CQMa 102) TaxID=655827 RepID=E9DUP5_METAQ|nr:glutathione S-transferase, putative [Metarhizium acridum CQMa 102]EFY92707.1 glutathione S-transferase, putative [Metarhizium acridum CQMa 102]KAG8425103.1 hypothetical protein J3458_001842 [Metarhizium acridum]
MSDIKPLTVWIHGQGPNPFKVLITLEELRVPYKTITIENPKEESFLKINPNGRLPAIQDPNANDMILWESGAIVEYIVENYDEEKKLTFTKGPEKWYLKQYLHFQMSGQGPYFGQHFWFRKFHPEDLPSAKKRYDEQTLRVLQVLDSILEGKEYLVGNRFTYADLVFIPWDRVVEGFSKDLLAESEAEKKYPNFFAWHKRLVARPAVRKVYGL